MIQTPSPDGPPRSRIWFSHNFVALPSSTDIERGQHNIWETTCGLRVDVLSAFAYILGPISCLTNSFPYTLDRAYVYSALTLLVLETHDDYVRFRGQLVESLFDSL